MADYQDDLAQDIQTEALPKPSIFEQLSMLFQGDGIVSSILEQLGLGGGSVENLSHQGNVDVVEEVEQIHEGVLVNLRTHARSAVRASTSTKLDKFTRFASFPDSSQEE